MGDYKREFYPFNPKKLSHPGVNVWVWLPPLLSTWLLSAANLEFMFPEISSISSGNKNSAGVFFVSFIFIFFLYFNFFFISALVATPPLRRRLLVLLLLSGGTKTCYTAKLYIQKYIEPQVCAAK